MYVVSRLIGLEKIKVGLLKKKLYKGVVTKPKAALTFLDLFII